MKYEKDNKYTDPYLKGTDLLELIGLLTDKSKDKFNFKFESINLYFESDLLINYNNYNQKTLLYDPKISVFQNDIININLNTVKSIDSYILLLKCIVQYNNKLVYCNQRYKFLNFKIFF